MFKFGDKSCVLGPSQNLNKGGGEAPLLRHRRLCAAVHLYPFWRRLIDAWHPRLISLVQFKATLLLVEVRRRFALVPLNGAPDCYEGFFVFFDADFPPRFPNWEQTIKTKVFQTGITDFTLRKVLQQNCPARITTTCECETVRENFKPKMSLT